MPLKGPIMLQILESFIILIKFIINQLKTKLTCRLVLLLFTYLLVVVETAMLVELVGVYVNVLKNIYHYGQTKVIKIHQDHRNCQKVMSQDT